MKISPKTMAAIYFVMGVFFIYIAILSAGETIWNFTTMVLALFATLEFGVSFRLIGLHVRLKNNKKE
ncbi:hypothetical protein GCM10009575_099440 [Streptomyces rhizosphaericus]|uniref:DUF4305 domain-containing protein n=1 Tax=Streptomyces rhizosphaericus TaxID=114699 RepID=A0ABN1RW15_9ACTN